MSDASVWKPVCFLEVLPGYCHSKAPTQERYLHASYYRGWDPEVSMETVLDVLLDAAVRCFLVLLNTDNSVNDNCIMEWCIILC